MKRGMPRYIFIGTGCTFSVNMVSVTAGHVKYLLGVLKKGRNKISTPMSFTLTFEKLSPRSPFNSCTT